MFNADFSQFRIEPMVDPNPDTDPEPWLAIRHLPCSTFVFDGDADAFDTLLVTQLIPMINAHKCPQEGKYRARAA